MSPGAMLRFAMPLVTLGAAAALVWGAWMVVGLLRRRRARRAVRSSVAARPVERSEASEATSCPPDEPCPSCRSGWSLDLSDEP